MVLYLFYLICLVCHQDAALKVNTHLNGCRHLVSRQPYCVNAVVLEQNGRDKI